MSRTIMLIPTGTGSGVGLTSISLGVICAMERHGVHFSIFKPISQPSASGHCLRPNQITNIFRKNFSIQAPMPLTMGRVESLWCNNQRDAIMDEIVASYHENIKDKDIEVILVEGLMPTRKHQFTSALNYEIAKTLNAEIVFLISLSTDSNDFSAQLKEHIEMTQSSFGGSKNKNIIGVIINKFNSFFDDSTKESRVVHIDNKQLFTNSPLPVLGYVPWSFELIATRAIDLCYHLDAKIINEGEIATRRLSSVTFCTYGLPHMLEHFRPSSLLVISADRSDVLIAACLATMSQLKIGAILLTGGYTIEVPIQKLCERAFQTGLPIFMVSTNTWQTSLNLQNFNNLELPNNDTQRIKYVKEYVANHINADWIKSLTTVSKRNRYFPPAVFRYQLIERARKAGKRIVLPEGDEPRTVKAAIICAERGIASCILLGNAKKIQSIAADQCVKLGTGIEIIDPEVLREKYVARLVELRKDKGMNEVVAKEQLEDNVMLGTMMLERGEVDGLVSGAIHTTANTIRPSLQLIKMASNSSLVSSIFFMLLPEQVLVYGDCAINLDPNPEQLAEIAIQSANSAAMFGIEPRVAMISYSTGNSGTGRDVEKVREATRIAQKKCPDLILDGPLQYDAAIMADVAKLKAPNSPVAGRATVFIFPDLNTGNTTYKAVQRSAGIISIGPMLQGMRKPVNDLSRGALVDDIVYTIALTAIQSKQTEG